MKAIPNQESREFRHYRIVVRHPRTEQPISIWCWLREADYSAAHAGMTGMQDCILQVVTARFNWDPNRLQLRWADLSFASQQTSPPKVLSTS
jgi:hypothetical protein